MIGDRIADAMQKVGNEGVITVEDSQTFGVELEFTEGMQFDKGYISPYFMTDADRQEASSRTPYILIANRRSAPCRICFRCSRRSCRAASRF